MLSKATIDLNCHVLVLELLWHLYTRFPFGLKLCQELRFLELLCARGAGNVWPAILALICEVA